MLDLVVNDALEGVDVILRYRRFYAMLLSDSNLHNDFITALELLEETSPSNHASSREPGEAGSPPDLS